MFKLKLKVVGLLGLLVVASACTPVKFESDRPVGGPGVTQTPPPKIPPTFPPNQPPAYPPTYPPAVSPALPPTVPPTYPPTYPPTVPPTYPPTYPPTVPPTYPPTYPPTVPPTYPPTGGCRPAGCFNEGGLQVCNIPPGGQLTFSGSASYGPNFPNGLPALGLGAPSLGYIPVHLPFTCIAIGGAGAVGTGNSGAGGKICEINFNNQVAGPTTVTASYTLSVDAGAPVGEQLYDFGFTCNYGCSVLTPNFKVRISCQ